MQHLLIVEDDKEINRLLCDFLTSQGYCVLSASDGLSAIRMLREHAELSLVLLDLMLPFQSGDRMLQELRTFSDVPVIILSARSTTQSKIDLIRMGADDYVTKPFDLDELLVRVEAVLRRSSIAPPSPAEELLVLHALQLQPASKTVSVGGDVLSLTSKEYAILELMLRHPTKLFSKANLFESVWNEAYFSDDNTIKVHMSNLRSKIKALDPAHEYIDTVWGMGYKLHLEN